MPPRRAERPATPDRMKSARTRACAAWASEASPQGRGQAMQGERSEPAVRGKAPQRGKPAPMEERVQAASVSANGYPAGGGCAVIGEAAATPKQCRRPQGESAPTTRPKHTPARSGRGWLNAPRRTPTRRSEEANAKRAPERSAQRFKARGRQASMRNREHERTGMHPA